MPDPTAVPRLSAMVDDLPAATRAAADAVDPGAIRDELQALVRIPSVTGHEEAVATELASRLGAAGMAADWLLPDPARRASGIPRSA